MVSTTSDGSGISRFESEKNVRFVNRQQYCEMLISSRQLTRCDLPEERIRGIFDSETGIRFLIEEKLLFA